MIIRRSKELAVATANVDLWAPFYSRGGGNLYAMQELELKIHGGLMREGGGVITGFYGICYNYDLNYIIIPLDPSFI